MKNLIPTKYLPLLALGCGLLGLLFRALLYALGVDDQGLLARGTFLNVLTWLPAVLATPLLVVGILPLKGSKHYRGNFSASPAGATGAFLAAVGILVSVLTGMGEYSDLLARARTVSGIAAALCLVVTGIARLRGRKPFFLFYGFICLFFALNLTHLYRVWSGIPQTQDYLFSLFACVFLMFFAYYQTGFAIEEGQRRPLLLTGLMGAMLCLTAMAHTDSPLFYLGCGAWCILNLCSLTPRRRRKPTPPTEDSAHENP